MAPVLLRRAFRGALPFTYHLGPGPATVHLQVEFNWNLTPAYDVIARNPRRRTGRRMVVRGNHHEMAGYSGFRSVKRPGTDDEEARAVANV